MSDYHQIVALERRITALERDDANLKEAINMIARGMANLVTLYESLHIRTTGEHIDYPAEDDDAE